MITRNNFYDEIRDYLEIRVRFDRRRHPTWPYSGFSEFLLAHGRLFERGTPPPRRGGWYRAVKQCYRNAFLNVLTDPTNFVFCEGFVWPEGDGMMGNEHAWFIDRRQPDLALDPTLTYRERLHYFGVPLSWQYVRDVVVAEEAHGSVFDWFLQADFPILTGRHSPEIVLADV